MQWWPRRGESGESSTATEVAPARPRHTGAVRDRPATGARRRAVRPERRSPDQGENPDPKEIAPVTIDRVREALDGLDVRFLNDPDGALLAMWERHAVLIALEGPVDEILMMRVRPHATVPRDWADRAYRVVNEWNHSRRFYKAYVGDVTERGQLPIYAEVQVPLTAGLHQALLAELLECGVSVAHGFVDWLHDDGCLL